MCLILTGCVERDDLLSKVKREKLTDSKETTTTTVDNTTTTLSVLTNITTTPTTIPKKEKPSKIPFARIQPKIDGIISDGEWDDAQIIEFSDIDRLLIKNNKDFVFFLYEVKDKNKYYEDSALYVDPDGDGLFNRAYLDNRVFLEYPFFKGFTQEDSYCKNPLFAGPKSNCGQNYNNIIAHSRIQSNITSTQVISEIAIPLGVEFIGPAGGEIYFWAYYGYPEKKCYPEVMQCTKNPSFIRMVLAAPE